MEMSQPGDDAVSCRMGYAECTENLAEMQKEVEIADSANKKTSAQQQELDSGKEAALAAYQNLLEAQQHFLRGPQPYGFQCACSWHAAIAAVAPTFF